MGQQVFAFMETVEGKALTDILPVALSMRPIETREVKNKTVRKNSNFTKNDQLDTKPESKLHPEAELFYAAQSGSKAAMDALLKKNEGLVFYTIYKLNLKKTPENIQAGMIGLWTAIKKYNPEQAAFATYAYYWIRQCVFREMDAQYFFPKHQTKIPKKRDKAHSIDAYEEWAESLPDEHRNEDIETMEAREEVNFLLERLDDTDKELLTSWVHGKPQKDIAKARGLSRQAISLRLDTLLKRLRVYCADVPDLVFA